MHIFQQKHILRKIMNLAQSFASLVKNNNGLFKSEAQAKFLLSQLDGKIFTTTATVYNNTVLLHYLCDETGVIKVTKESMKNGNVTVTFERGKMSDVEKKKIRKYEREIKQLREGLIEREEIKSRNEPGCAYADEDFYNSVLESINNDITNRENWIKQIKNKYQE